MFKLVLIQSIQTPLLLVKYRHCWLNHILLFIHEVCCFVYLYHHLCCSKIHVCPFHSWEYPGFSSPGYRSLRQAQHAQRKGQGRQLWQTIFLADEKWRYLTLVHGDCTYQYLAYHGYISTVHIYIHIHTMMCIYIYI